MDSVKDELAPQPGLVSAGGAATAVAVPQAGPDAHARHQAFLAFVRAKEQAWAAMSPAEREAAESDWASVMRNIDDARAGHRKVFVD